MGENVKERKLEASEEESEGEGLADNADENANYKHRDDRDDGNDGYRPEQEENEDTKPLFSKGLPSRSGTERFKFYCSGCRCVSTSCVTSPRQY